MDLEETITTHFERTITITPYDKLKLKLLIPFDIFLPP